jgi:hypothetical protein
MRYASSNLPELAAGMQNTTGVCTVHLREGLRVGTGSEVSDFHGRPEEAANMDGILNYDWFPHLFHEASIASSEK